MEEGWACDTLPLGKERRTGRHEALCLPLPRHLGRSWGGLLILVQVVHGGRLQLQRVDQDVGLGGKVIWEEWRKGSQCSGGAGAHDGAAQGRETAPLARQEAWQGPPPTPVPRPCTDSSCLGRSLQRRGSSSRRHPHLTLPVSPQSLCLPDLSPPGFSDRSFLLPHKQKETQGCPGLCSLRTPARAQASLPAGSHLRAEADHATSAPDQASVLAGSLGTSNTPNLSSLPPPETPLPDAAQPHSLWQEAWGPGVLLAPSPFSMPSRPSSAAWTTSHPVPFLGLHTPFQAPQHPEGERLTTQIPDLMPLPRNERPPRSPAASAPAPCLTHPLRTR